jgi:hypothetical protein
MDRGVENALTVIETVTRNGAMEYRDDFQTASSIGWNAAFSMPHPR